MTSIEKIRESIDEVVAQVLLQQAEQLRNEVSERLRPLLEEDSRKLQGIEQQLQQRSEQAHALEAQLTQTRNEISAKQQQVESLEKQLGDFKTQNSNFQQQAQQTEAELRGRVTELENVLRLESDRLTKQTQDLEQLLELSQDEVKELQNREAELKKQLGELEGQLAKLRAEMEQALQKRDEEHRAVLAEKDKTVAEKHQEHEAKVRQLEEKIEAVRKEAAETQQNKEKDLLDQVHLLEELLVQGQNAREQQLDAKDRELKSTIATQKTEYEARITELQAQLSDRDKVFQQQGTELQQRVVGLETELTSTQKQFASAQKELQQAQAAFEKAQQQLDEAVAVSKKREEEISAQLKAKEEKFAEQLRQWQHREEELVGGQATLSLQQEDFNAKQAAWEQREKDLVAQLAGLEKRLGEFTANEQSWQQREQELLGHRDQVLSSSAEASEANQKALKAALEDQQRLQLQLDAMIEELGRVRGELQRAQDGGAGVPAAAASQPVNESAQVESAIEKIHSVHSQTEVLKVLLEKTAAFAERAGILVLHGHSAAGWGARGFDPEADFRKLNVECNSGLAARVLQGRAHVSGKATEFDSKLVKHFGASADGQAAVFPLVVRDRVVALLYADGGKSGRVVSTDSLDAMVQAAGAWLHELAKNKKAAAGSELPTPSASAAAAPATEAQPAVAMAVAAGAGSGTAQEAPSGGGDVARQRARRFAKLLVDEIKLYNKEAVEMGRQHSDLYDRLRESIDKSRASYEKRWGKTVTDVDYFREELVRNLAENNVAVLGANFPR